MVEVVLPEPVQMYKDMAIITHSHNVGGKAHNRGICLVYLNMSSCIIQVGTNILSQMEGKLYMEI